ncbi:MAG: hypothetical protein WD231_05640 [Candidatus Woykebacteria bacterium]
MQWGLARHEKRFDLGSDEVVGSLISLLTYACELKVIVNLFGINI